MDSLFRRAGRRESGYARPFVLAADVNGAACSSATTRRGEDDHDRHDGLTPSASTTTLPRGVSGSVHIIARGEGPRRRFLVRYRLGGRETPLEHAGSFKRKNEAMLRRNFLIGLMTAGQGHEIRSRLRNTDAPSGTATVRTAAERWQASRVDVAAGTSRRTRSHSADPSPHRRQAARRDRRRRRHRPRRRVSTLKRESIRKTLDVLAHDPRPRARATEPRP